MINHLFEELHRTAEHTEIVVTLDVAIETAADTFGVTHLTEYTAVGGCDTFNGTDGVVGIEENVACGVAVKVNVLCCDLTVFCKLGKKCGVAEEAAFAVRNRHCVDIANIRFSKPRRFVGCNTRTNEPGLVARDRVECKRGASFICIYNLAVGNKTELYKSLETVADTAHKSVSVIK